MPFVIPVQVDVPPTCTFNVEEFSAELTRFAQSLIDAKEAETVYDEAELAQHTCTVDELCDGLIEMVDEYYRQVAA